MLILILVVTTLVIPVIQSSKQTCYIKTAGCLPSIVAPCYDWLNVTENFGHCIKVCEVLLFSPGVYFLNATLTASNDRSVSFIGASATTTNIVCLEQPSLFAAINVGMLKIINISWTNCGGSLEDMHLTISRSYTTLLLHNVTSANIYNVVFNSSQGYALFGVNLQSKLSLLNVSLLNTASLAHTDADYCRGIMVINLPVSTSKAHHNQSQDCFILINHCKFYNMQIFDNLNASKDYTNKYSSIHYVTAAIGLIFHQHVIINISNTLFVNLLSNNMPVVSILCLINKPTLITVVNSTFKNVNYTSSLVEIKILVQHKDSCMYPLHISFQNCTFSHNSVTQLIQMTHVQSDTTASINASIKVEIHMSHSLFDTNKAISDIWDVSLNRNILNASVLIVDCTFLSNNVTESALKFKGIYSLALNGINTFVSNCAKVQIYLSCIERFSLQGNVTFSNNRVNVLIYLNDYTIIDVNYTSLNITNNQIAKVNDIMQQHKFYLIYMIPNVLNSEACAFKILQCVKNVTLLRTRTIFQNNVGYQGVINKFPLNSCKWYLYCNQHRTTLKLSFNIFKKFNFIYYDKSGGKFKNITDKEKGICYCEYNANYTITNCSRSKLGITIYPGQTIFLPLLTRGFNSSVGVTVTSYDEEGSSVCPPVYHNICFPAQQLNIVYETCTNLSFTVRSNSTDWCMLCLKTVTQSQDNPVYSFNITLQKCPLGLVHYNGVCICNPKLSSDVKNLMCNLDGTLTRPPYTWISAIDNMTDVVYSTECYMDYCSESVIYNLNLSDPDAQCSYNRGGILCGRCAEGFSAVFGTSRCKECSNVWLLLIPVLAVAGILLVGLLFALNLTVVDGHIYGYIFYVNILSLYSSRIFPSNYLIYSPILLSNLDLGIEVCFYNGMTNYATTWLQFIFPVYVISLVIGLSFASKYSRMIERLTRKRVIPVIATLCLLAYNKMIIITAKGLFAYRTIHYLNTQKERTYWSLYTQIPLFGLEFILLFVFCILVLALLILPTSILFLFPKFLLKYRFVSKYVKPFLDAYLAPFKSTCYHSLGVELIIRVIIYATPSSSIRADYIALIYSMILLLYLAYLSIQQPFKSSLNTIVYTMYICNLGCLALLFTYYPITEAKLYTITFNILVGIGFAVFLGIILLHSFKYCAPESVSVMFSKIIRKWKQPFSSTDVHDDSPELEALNFIQRGEDLDLLEVAVDPDD